MKKSAVCFFLFSILFSCASIPEPSSKIESIIVGELVYFGTGHNNGGSGRNINGTATYGIDISIKNKDTGEILYFRTWRETGFFGGYLKPGNYSIVQFNYKDEGSDGGFSQTWTNPASYLNFTVKAGSVNNLGKIKWTSDAINGTFFTFNKDYSFIKNDFSNYYRSSRWNESVWTNTIFTKNDQKNDTASDKETNQKLKIKSVGWSFDNIDKSYWPSPVPKTSCFLNFFVFFTKDVSPDIIDYVKISDEDTNAWIISPKEFSSYKKGCIGGFTFFPSAKDSDKICIGKYLAEAKLKNGDTLTQKFTVSTVGRVDTDMSNYLSTSPSKKDKKTGFMISRASDVSSFKTENSEYKISFSVVDSRIYNGFVWFLNKNKTKVASSVPFINKTNGTVSSVINDGTIINNDGTKNSVILRKNDFSFEDGFDEKDIEYAVVVLTDGKQFSESKKYWSYDFRSISAVSKLKKK
jgi:hypothetical protein